MQLNHQINELSEQVLEHIKKNQKVILLINMTANVRRWQETTTGRKEEPIVEEKPVKKKTTKK